MKVPDTLQPHLDAALAYPFGPWLGAGLGALATFLLMQWLVTRWQRRYRALQDEHRRLHDRVDIETRLREEKASSLAEASREMRLQFENLAHQIFDQKSRALSRHNSEKIDGLLQPYREQLQTFRDRIETIFLEESRDHSSLKQELLNLRELNDRINQEALRLSRAISGDNRQQGSWGEMVLERLLEQSGLRRGEEFETQGGLRDDDNRLYRPDVIVHLPDDKDIVIDSKVSLGGWSKFVNAASEEERGAALKEHLRSLRGHLKSLSAKDYSSLRGLRTLDFVLMFIPIEGAFSAAVQADQDLVADMYTRQVIIVTPTTLLATLRMIGYFWQHERQSRNAVEIAERAGSLYDKLCGFVADMERLGVQIDNCRDTYDKAINKLTRGRGNLISQAARFPELGVKVKEELAASTLDNAG